MQNAPREHEHAAILLTFIKQPFVFKTFVLSTFEWQLKTGFTVYKKNDLFVCFVALRPRSTAMVIAGRSVHLTTLFSWASLNKQLTSNRAHTFACN